MPISTVIANQRHTFQQLSHTARRLLLSSLCYCIADLLIFTFAHAYLFTQTNSFYSVILFTLGYYIMLPIAFFANALLLKRVSVKKLFAIGMIGQGIVMSFLVFIPHLTLPSILLFGIVFGFPMGLYWANRNFLMVADIPDKQRNYIAGVDGSFSEVMSVLLPLLAGWFIVLSHQWGGIPTTIAYQCIMLGGAIAFTIGALLLKNATITTPIIHTTSIRKVPKDWQKMRLFILFSGALMVTNTVLPEMLILHFLGDEGTLGSIKAIMALIVAVCLYWVGKRAQVSDRYRILFLSITPLFLGGFLLIFQVSALTITLFLLLQAIAGSFLWFVYFPVLGQVVERQDNGSVAHNYRYILDHELIINISRISFILVIIGLLYFLDFEQALTICIILVGISQVGMLIVAKQLLKQAPQNQLVNQI